MDGSILRVSESNAARSLPPAAFLRVAMPGPLRSAPAGGAPRVASLEPGDVLRVGGGDLGPPGLLRGVLEHGRLLRLHEHRHELEVAGHLAVDGRDGALQARLLVGTAAPARHHAREERRRRDREAADDAHRLMLPRSLVYVIRIH